MASVRPGTSSLLEYNALSGSADSTTDGAGWSLMGPWDEIHSSETCGRGQSTCRAHSFKWPFCDATKAPGASAPARNQCGAGFDGGLAFSCFEYRTPEATSPSNRYVHDARAPPQVPCPLRMHGVWSPDRGPAARSRGTVIIAPGVTYGTTGTYPVGNLEGAAFGPGCLFSALLGSASLPRLHQHGRRQHLEPLPDNVSMFRCIWPKIKKSNIYQLPTGVLLIAAAIESIMKLGRGPIVLVGHSLGGGAVIEAAARVLYDHPPGWLAGVCTLAGQPTGLHVDNAIESSIGSLEHACHLLGKETRPSAPFIYKNDHFTKTGSGQT